MLFMSIVCLFVTPFLELANLTDWWNPHFIFNTYPLYLEDLLFGFSLGGVASALYSLLIDRFHIPSLIRPFSRIKKVIIILIMLFLFYIPFHFLHMSSFWSEMLSCGIAILLISFHLSFRSLLSMLLTGMLLIIMITPGYFLGMYLNPGWIEEEWLLKGFAAFPVFGIPIAEFIFYMLVGLTIPSLQELLFNKNNLAYKEK